MSKLLSQEIEAMLRTGGTVNELARLLHSSIITIRHMHGDRMTSLRTLNAGGSDIKVSEIEVDFDTSDSWVAIKQLVVQIQRQLHMGQYCTGDVEYAGTEVTVEKSSVHVCYQYVVKTPAKCLEEGDFLFYLGIPSGILLKYESYVVFTATGALVKLDLTSSLVSEDAWDKEMEENRSIEFIMDL